MATLIETPTEHVIEEIERDLGLTSSELASALDVTPRTVERWRAGAAVPQREARQRLNALTDLHAHLRASFTAEDIPAWLRERHHYLGGLSPAEAIRAGRADRVEALLIVIDYGIFT